MNPLDAIRLDRSRVHIGSHAETPPDAWAERSVEQRIEGVEYLRAIFYGPDQVGQRLQRVFSIAYRT